MLYMTGLLPGVTQEQLEICDHLATQSERILAHAAFIMTNRI
jgi:hypothetical protein